MQTPWPPPPPPDGPSDGWSFSDIALLFIVLGLLGFAIFRITRPDLFQTAARAAPSYLPDTETGDVIKASVQYHTGATTSNETIAGFGMLFVYFVAHTLSRTLRRASNIYRLLRFIATLALFIAVVLGIIAAAEQNEFYALVASAIVVVWVKRFWFLHPKASIRRALDPYFRRLERQKRDLFHSVVEDNRDGLGLLPLDRKYPLGFHSDDLIKSIELMLPDKDEEPLKTALLEWSRDKRDQLVKKNLTWSGIKGHEEKIKRLVKQSLEQDKHKEDEARARIIKINKKQDWLKRHL